ncbi:MAG: radical SAM protein [Candidatus Omnitrophica bacterium]|nr:radical SAM protein [Candidatus Omnitrophota bacterium]
MKKKDTKGKAISVGIGTTGNCNLSCPHCYSRPLRGYTLTLEDVAALIDGKNVKSINFGTGENILNPDFVAIVDHCHDRGIKLSLTSNGYGIIALADDVLRKFNDIDISLEFLDKKLQDDFRHGNSWDFVGKSIEKCKRLGVEFSIATALMNVNYKEVPRLLEKAATEGCNLRLNVFKPVPKAGITKFALTYEEFWEAIGLLFSHGRLISCSEPIVNAMLNIPPIVPQSPCGMSSIRVHPTGQVVPCVYWSEGDVHINDLVDSFEPAFQSKSFRDARIIPEWCTKNCDKVNVCGGGCVSRRFLSGDINAPDRYCPIYHKKTIPAIKVTHAKGSKDLVHSSYLCTLIFEGV